MRHYKYEVGIDEAGRGPLAGPVAVGLAIVPSNFDWKLLPYVGDSKQVSVRRREQVFEYAKKLRKEGRLNYTVSLVGAQVIDARGITTAVQLGINRCLKRVAVDPGVTSVKLDGLLRAPSQYVWQETIVKGDAKEKIIGLASILAKVTRDRYMVRKARDYPEYGFELHKGYGTKMHGRAIQEYGVSRVHRVSFIHI